MMINEKKNRTMLHFTEIKKKHLKKIIKKNFIISRRQQKRFRAGFSLV